MPQAIQDIALELALPLRRPGGAWRTPPSKRSAGGSQRPTNATFRCQDTHWRQSQPDWWAPTQTDMGDCIYMFVVIG